MMRTLRQLEHGSSVRKFKIDNYNDKYHINICISVDMLELEFIKTNRQEK